MVTKRLPSTLSSEEVEEEEKKEEGQEEEEEEEGRKKSRKNTVLKMCFLMWMSSAKIYPVSLLSSFSVFWWRFPGLTQVHKSTRGERALRPNCPSDVSDSVISPKNYKCSNCSTVSIFYCFKNVILDSACKISSFLVYIWWLMDTKNCIPP